MIVITIKDCNRNSSIIKTIKGGKQCCKQYIENYILIVSSHCSVNRQEAVVTDGGTMIRTDGGRPNDGVLKMVTGIVRPDKLGDVKQAVAGAGAPSLTVTTVSGRGSQASKKGQ